MATILIINQPTGNRGDEAAHKALVRSLATVFPNFKIEIVFLGETDESIGTMRILKDNVRYTNSPIKKGKTRIPKLAYELGLNQLLMQILPPYAKVAKYIKQSDYIICAPGGICMGAFMNWNHILLLDYAKQRKKKIAYYSRSIGPFSLESREKRIFAKKSVELLKSFDFLSLRDNVSMKYADELGLNYISSIDTAFLEQPKCIIPLEIADKIGRNYVLFVPNSLVWHPSYNNVPKSRIESLYHSIIQLLCEFFKDCKVVMMPQLYGLKEGGDVIYFNKLLDSSIRKERIVVLSDTLSSDEQQSIVKNAKCVIGARYHSIVFAINNNIPFVSLSYEHKMFGLLSILGLEDYQINLTKIKLEEYDNSVLIDEIKSILNKKK